jgi:hypothetical protein
VAKAPLGVAQKKGMTSASYTGEKATAGASAAYASAAEEFANVVSDAAQYLRQLLKENAAPYLRELPRMRRLGKG